MQHWARPAPQPPSRPIQKNDARQSPPRGTPANGVPDGAMGGVGIQFEPSRLVIAKLLPGGSARHCGELQVPSISTPCPKQACCPHLHVLTPDVPGVLIHPDGRSAPFRGEQRGHGSSARPLTHRWPVPPPALPHLLAPTFLASQIPSRRLPGAEIRRSTIRGPGMRTRPASLSPSLYLSLSPFLSAGGRHPPPSLSLSLSLSLALLASPHLLARRRAASG